MKSHEITLSPTRPPRSKHPSKRPCESQSTGPTRQNLSDWRYASIKDWKVAWKIPRRMVDDGRFRWRSYWSANDLPKTNRGGVLSQCSMRKKQRKGTTWGDRLPIENTRQSATFEQLPSQFLKSLKLHLARDTNLLGKVAQSWLACSLLHSLKNEKTGPCQGLEEVWLTETENEVEICLCSSLRVKTMRHI